MTQDVESTSSTRTQIKLDIKAISSSSEYFNSRDQASSGFLGLGPQQGSEDSFIHQLKDQKVINKMMFSVNMANNTQYENIKFGSLDSNAVRKGSQLKIVKTLD